MPADEVAPLPRRMKCQRLCYIASIIDISATQHVWHESGIATSPAAILK